MPGTEARAAVGVSPAIICEGRREKEGNSVRIGVWGKRKNPTLTRSNANCTSASIVGGMTEEIPLKTAKKRGSARANDKRFG